MSVPASIQQFTPSLTTFTMAGHVNMMDDVLISQLPPAILRSSLRALVSQGAAAQKIFVEHVRRRLVENPPLMVPPAELFGGDQPRYNDFMASTRCLFSSKMAFESLPYLTHLLVSIPQTNTRWAANDELELALDKVSGDIVQAIQALKESRPTPTPELKSPLLALRMALDDCETYCSTNGLSYPFARARLQVDDMISLMFPDMTPDQSQRRSSVQCKFDVVPDTSISDRLEYVQLGTINVPRLFNGFWQMSSPAWGSASSHKQQQALAQLLQVGLVAADMADHYGDAELVYGSFRRSLSPTISKDVIAATKWCVFRPLEKPVTAELVLEAVQERSRRLGGRIELLQFHWYNYAVKDYLLILAELVKLTHTHPNLVSNIGLCNFDAEHTEEACKYLLHELGRVGIVSNQVQYSLIDSRPSVKMAAICEKYDIKLLTYGSFCGGFLSEKWLGAAAPDVYSEAAQLTPSQRKYFDMIMNWGSWSDLQGLLILLKRIADKHNVDLVNVATRWVLNRPEVGAVIVGTRLGVSNNSVSNLKAFSLKLDEGDMRQLDEVALGRARSLFAKIGDCGHEYQ